ncbi:MAG: alpha/beta fold hydrolase [Dehalococcoidia bacterium]
MPKLMVDGVNIYYEVHGAGFPLVLTHGFAGTTQMWRPQVPALSQRYRLILYDMRGHGQSDSPPSLTDYSLDIALNDLYQLLRHLGAEQAVVGGLSLGGYLSLHFYRQHSEMVRALILADTGPGYRNPQRRQEWDRVCIARAEILEEGGMAAFAQSPYAASDYYTPPDLLLKLNPIGLANVSRAVMAGAWGVEIVPQINVPTLVICGERDTDFIPATDYMAATIPDARKVIIANAGHGSNVDDSEAFNRAVLDFLAETGV